MNVNAQKKPSTASERVRQHPTEPTTLDETAEPEGQFPHAAPHDAPAEEADEPEDAHVGATEEQIGDRTGPGAGYDDTSTEQAASLPQGGQGMGQGRGGNPGQQKAAKDEADVEEKRQDPPKKSKVRS